MDRDDNRRSEREGNLSRDANRDPITGQPGAHPVGTGLGAATGGAAGGAIGAVAGPIGAAVGAATGAVLGGLVGKGVGEAIDPTAEDAYWRANYATRSYVRPGASYETLAPAYRYGWETYGAYGPKGVSFDQAEPELRERWLGQRPGSSMDWPSAREAVKDAWTRLESRVRSARGAAASRIETKSAKETRESLNDLIQICRDGAMGYRLAAEKVGPAYAPLFNEFATDRERFATELQDEVRALGGEPRDSGDTTGALHRGWINIKAAFSSGDKAIIDECERGEDAAVEAYQKALQSGFSPEVYSVVARQYTRVKGAHDRVSAIKHSME